MSCLATVNQHEGSLLVSGGLDFASVVTVFQQSLPYLSQQAVLQIDLAGVTSSNSAGLTLLLEWARYAKQYQKSIQFKNVPEKLLSVAHVAGVASLFSAVQ